MEKDKTKRTPTEWEEIVGIRVVNAIGWGHGHGQLVPKSYHKKISRREFHRRSVFSIIESRE